jgi:hypothetical protein
VPHPAIGGARRMQVPQTDKQHMVMVSTGSNADECFGQWRAKLAD